MNLLIGHLCAARISEKTRPRHFSFGIECFGIGLKKKKWQQNSRNEFLYMLYPENKRIVLRSFWFPSLYHRISLYIGHRTRFYFPPLKALLNARGIRRKWIGGNKSEKFGRPAEYDPISGFKNSHVRSSIRASIQRALCGRRGTSRHKYHSIFISESNKQR